MAVASREQLTPAGSMWAEGWLMMQGFRPAATLGPPQRMRSTTDSSSSAHGAANGAEGKGASRRALPWYEDGRDPDYRFSLANERTFLAWIRTSLALLAGALVLHQLATVLHLGSLASWGGAALCLLAGVLGASAYPRWKGNEIAMRHGRSLPLTALTPLLAVVVLLMSIAAGLYVVKAL